MAPDWAHPIYIHSMAIYMPQYRVHHTHDDIYWSKAGLYIIKFGRTKLIWPCTFRIRYIQSERGVTDGVHWYSRAWSAGFTGLQVSSFHPRKYLKNSTHLSDTRHWRLRTERGKSTEKRRIMSPANSPRIKGWRCRDATGLSTIYRCRCTAIEADVCYDDWL